MAPGTEQRASRPCCCVKRSRRSGPRVPESSLVTHPRRCLFSAFWRRLKFRLLDIYLPVFFFFFSYSCFILFTKFSQGKENPTLQVSETPSHPNTIHCREQVLSLPLDNQQTLQSFIFCCLAIDQHLRVGGLQGPSGKSCRGAELKGARQGRGRLPGPGSWFKSSSWPWISSVAWTSSLTSGRLSCSRNPERLLTQ